MTSEFEQNLEKYAEVIVKVGLNIQPGQRLLIGWPAFGIYGTPIELVPLVRLVVKKAYQAGARLVDVLWNDDQLRLIRFQEAPRDSFEEFPEWRTNAVNEISESGDALLSFYAEDPELLKDQDSELVGVFHTTNWKYVGPSMDLATKNAMNWTVATAPVDGWVEKLFPSLPADEAKIKFWDTIFEICRIKDADPVAAWNAHIRALSGRVDYLNHKKYAALKYSAPGTDLTVGLPKGHLWHGGRMTNQNGIDFTPNIPTEEVFTLPHKAKVDGFVSSTRPLGYGGSLIENFTLKFANGKVVEIDAKKDEGILRNLIETDEGASYLGEVALVPNSSPISQTGMLFGNILLDENASSHLALGRAYQFSVEKGEEMSDEEFAATGGNQSMVHVDFMIGSGKMDVDGVMADGTTEPVMRAGEWAFDV
jgi:aminopeptidase